MLKKKRNKLSSHFFYCPSHATPPPCLLPSMDEMSLAVLEDEFKNIWYFWSVFTTRHSHHSPWHPESPSTSSRWMMGANTLTGSKSSHAFLTHLFCVLLWQHTTHGTRYLSQSLVSSGSWTSLLYPSPFLISLLHVYLSHLPSPKPLYFSRSFKFMMEMVCYFWDHFSRKFFQEKPLIKWLTVQNFSTHPL